MTKIAAERNWALLVIAGRSLPSTGQRTPDRSLNAIRPVSNVMDHFKLSVVIPVYNERQWLRELVARVEAAPVPKEIILVDDGSTDGTRDILAEMEQRGHRVFYQPVNRGKGAAVRLGFQEARGDIVLIQDADLEYDPADYGALLQPILDGKADVVFGSRFLGKKNQQARNVAHYVANRFITTLSNLFTSLHLTDMETCYKVFHRQVLEKLTLTSNRFGIEPELTARIAARRNPAWRVREVPIRYTGRSYEEGKKIGFKDALQAIYCVVRFGLFE